MKLLIHVFNAIGKTDTKSFYLFIICILLRIAVAIIPVYFMQMAMSDDKERSDYGMNGYALCAMINPLIF